MLEIVWNAEAIDEAQRLLEDGSSQLDAILQEIKESLADLGRMGSSSDRGVIARILSDLERFYGSARDARERTGDILGALRQIHILFDLTEEENKARIDELAVGRRGPDDGTWVRFSHMNGFADGAHEPRLMHTIIPEWLERASVE